MIFRVEARLFDLQLIKGKTFFNVQAGPTFSFSA